MGFAQRCFTCEERLDILHVYKNFRSKRHKELTLTVAKSLSRSHDVAKAIIREYGREGPVTAAVPTANRSNRETQVPNA
jgi:hypothetical protein